MNQQGRFILAIVLSLAIVVGWGYFFAPKSKPGVTSSAPVATAPTAAAPATPGATAATPPAAGAPAPGGEPEPPAQTTVIETPLWTAAFSSEGAGLTKFELKGRKQEARRKEDSAKTDGVNLAHPGEGQPLPLSTEIGTIEAGFGPRTPFKLASQADGELVYERTRGNLAVTKRFRWKPDSYLLDLEVTVRKLDGVAGEVPVRVLYTSWEVHQKPSGMFSFGPRTEVHQAVCLPTGERSMKTKSYSEGKPPDLFPQAPHFAGIDEKYFVAAVAPKAAQPAASCALAAPTDKELEASILQPVTLAAGTATGTAAFDVYLGPKETDLLQAAGHELDRTVDYGFFALICKVLLSVLKRFHDLAGNWGVAIILLTLLVKAITFPLSHRQMKSMEAMKQLGPKLEELKKKYETDQARLNVETMKLYKENNVSPIGCAVPMLVQMPVWFALYSTLQNSFDIYNEPFIRGWISDLTVHDPYYVTPVLMTLTMVATQVLTPQQTSPQAQQMKAMTYGMPVFFGFMMLSLPAGLVLYIFTNNLLSIGQSLWFRRRVAAMPVKA
jgi:YidC/Oxa1 family membrane protein insertase